MLGEPNFGLVLSRMARFCRSQTAGEVDQK
jgi:hypothetical protein